MNLFLRSLIAAGVKTGLGLYLTQTIRNILYASAHNKPRDIRDTDALCVGAQSNAWGFVIMWHSHPVYLRPVPDNPLDTK